MIKKLKSFTGNSQNYCIVARIWSIENIQRDNVKDIHTRFTKADRLYHFAISTGDPEMIQFGKKLKTARNSMFTFVKYAGVPSN